MIKIYLDDIRTPVDKSWIIVRNYNEFVKQILSLSSDDEYVISFDHDLADEHYTPKEYRDDYEASKTYQENKQYKEMTWNDCAKELVSIITRWWLKKPYICYIHSFNPVWADNIKRTLNDIWIISEFVKIDFY